MFVNPWDKKSTQIFKQLHIYNGKASTTSKSFVQTFRRKYPEILNKGLLDMATTRYSKRPDKTILQTPPDVDVLERITKRGIRFEFKRKFF